MNIREVKPILIPLQSEMLADSFFRTCAFCQKVITINKDTLQTVSNLSGQSQYCTFCLRHNFKINRHVLGLSYRALIGYYYRDLYLEKQTLYFTELTDMIEEHVAEGMAHPAFIYDASNYMWYINFTMIGDSSNKGPIDEVQKTVLRILHRFRIGKLCGLYAESQFYLRMEKSIKSYYKMRKRPPERKFLIPTLKDLVHHSNESIWDESRNFLPRHLKIK